MKLSRRQVLRTTSALTAAAALGLGASVSRAAKINYKLAHGTPTSHPNSARIKAAVDKINEDAKGALEIQLFPAAQLGLDAAMLSQVRSGGIDFYTTSGVSISTAAGATAAINAMPFVFKSYAEVWPAMDGDLGRVIRETIAKIGLRVFEKPWDSGYRQITTSSKPINHPDDLKGFKMRVPISPINTSLFKALGASPVTIDFNELYLSLQTKIADGEENPLAFVDAGKLYEVQKYCSLTNHIWDGIWFFANPRSWEALPKEMQQLVDNRINGEAPAAREDIQKTNDTLRASLESKGMIFNSPNLEPFRDVLRNSGYYKEWSEKFDKAAWTILEKYAGKLT
jgi:TRAP-type transport system periplasmic protein